MSTQLISAFPTFEKSGTGSINELNVSEFFYDTVQGEGIYTGQPASFLRLQGCTLNCIYCDTEEVWREGNPYTTKELIDLITKSELLHKLANGHHLVITGGSPFLQQFALIHFLQELIDTIGFTPFIEIENECVRKPLNDLLLLVSCWNNSPKLSNSGNSRFARYKPDVIGITAALKNSWFKFVVTCEEDWEEIQMDFLDTNLILLRQIILMPEGQTREEIAKHSSFVVDMAIKHHVRYSDRLHIQLWNKKTGV